MLNYNELTLQSNKIEAIIYYCVGAILGDFTGALLRSSKPVKEPKLRQHSTMFYFLSDSKHERYPIQIHKKKQ